MARKSNTTVTIPTTFVGSFYDVKAGVYIATRKDGTMTVGQIGRKGINVEAGGVYLLVGGEAEVKR